MRKLINLSTFIYAKILLEGSNMKTPIRFLFILTLISFFIISNAQVNHNLKKEILNIENHLSDKVVISTSKFYNIYDRMKFYNVPGVSIAVISHGKIGWLKAYGVKEAGTSDSITTETLFQIASIGKSLTGTLAMTLVQGGKIKL